MEDFENICNALVQCARFVATGNLEDARIYLTRTARSNLKKTDSSIWMLIRDSLNELPHEIQPSRNMRGITGTPIRTVGSPLVQYEEFPAWIPISPIWPQNLQETFNQIILEWDKKDELKKAGLTATRSILFAGPPGVGKTLAAKWLANELKLPVLTLNLASVMSSLLGKTGNNIQSVFTQAKEQSCVLLLDEFDSIAKKRDDLTEVGELKRLVTVLLQEIDHWGENSLLIAATNHQSLLDPAVWRRFDIILNFEKPNAETIEKVIRLYLGSDLGESEKLIPVLKIFFQNYSYSDIQKSLQQIRKASLLHKRKITNEIMKYVADNIKNCDKSDNIQLAIQLVNGGISQRQASEITGVSRDTIRKKVSM